MQEWIQADCQDSVQRGCRKPNTVLKLADGFMHAKGCSRSYHTHIEWEKRQNRVRDPIMYCHFPILAVWSHLNCRKRRTPQTKKTKPLPLPLPMCMNHHMKFGGPHQVLLTDPKPSTFIWLLSTIRGKWY